MTHNSDSKSKLCSTLSSSNGEDLGGSAPSWTNLLLFELALPWEESIHTNHNFPKKVADLLYGVNLPGEETRLQCIAPDPAYSSAGTRVMLFTKPKKHFSMYNKLEFQVPDNLLISLIETLLTQGTMTPFDHYRNHAVTRDILVCTHGSHDVCCASLGYPIYEFLKKEKSPPSNIQLRIWRTNHVGGHRFAPNIIDMPEGRMWARLNKRNIKSWLTRTRPANAFKKFYRGWAAMNSPYMQIAEREILATEDWDWTKQIIQTSSQKLNNNSNHARLIIRATNASNDINRTYTATVKMTGTVPKIDCITGKNTGEYNQYTVRELLVE